MSMWKKRQRAQARSSSSRLEPARGWSEEVSFLARLRVSRISLSHRDLPYTGCALFAFAPAAAGPAESEVLALTDDTTTREQDHPLQNLMLAMLSPIRSWHPSNSPIVLSR